MTKATELVGKALCYTGLERGFPLRTTAASKTLKHWERGHISAQEWPLPKVHLRQSFDGRQENRRKKSGNEIQRIRDHTKRASGSARGPRKKEQMGTILRPYKPLGSGPWCAGPTRPRTQHDSALSFVIMRTNCLLAVLVTGWFKT